jgi:hypothetical protein
MMQPKTVTPKPLIQNFLPTRTIEVQGNTRACPSGATQGIKTLCGSQLRSTSAQCIASVMLLTKVLECAHARSRMLAKC